LLQIKAITALNHKSKHYDLLLVFLNENLTGYQQFIESNKDFITTTNLDAEANVRKMRLLSLASLGSENLSRDLKYSQIAATLQIPQDEVEMWVIDVIRAGLVEAKLNQLTKTVIVHRSIVGVFGKEQWKQLSDKLNGWKQSLTDILTVVSNAKLIAANQGLGGGGVAEVTMQTTTSVEVNGQ
jgi:translation initiation factor 3 subunit M